MQTNVLKKLADLHDKHLVLYQQKIVDDNLVVAIVSPVMLRAHALP